MVCALPFRLFKQQSVELASNCCAIIFICPHKWQHELGKCLLCVCAACGSYQLSELLGLRASVHKQLDSLTPARAARVVSTKRAALKLSFGVSRLLYTPLLLLILPRSCPTPPLCPLGCTQLIQLGRHLPRIAHKFYVNCTGVQAARRQPS